MSEDKSIYLTSEFRRQIFLKAFNKHIDHCKQCLNNPLYPCSIGHIMIVLIAKDNLGTICEERKKAQKGGGRI